MGIRSGGGVSVNRTISINRGLQTWAEKQLDPEALTILEKNSRLDSGSNSRVWESGLATILNSPELQNKTLEQITDQGLTNIEPTDSDLVKAAKLLLKKFTTNPRLSQSILLSTDFVGNSHNTMGDIHVNFRDANGEDLQISEELKFGENDTLANLSTSILTESGIFGDGTLASFNDFLKNTNHVNDVKDFFEKLYQVSPEFKQAFDEKFTGWDQIKKDSTKDIHSLSTMAKHILFAGEKKSVNVEKYAKDMIESGSGTTDQLATAATILKITELAAKNRTGYMDTLKTATFDNNKAATFAALLLTGELHKSDHLISEIKTKSVANILPKNYDYSFITNQNGKTNLKYSTNYRKALALINKPGTKVEAVFQDDQQQFKFVAKGADGTVQNLFAVSVYWKNGFQGIATPAMNIFMEKSLRDYEILKED